MTSLWELPHGVLTPRLHQGRVQIGPIMMRPAQRRLDITSPPPHPDPGTIRRCSCPAGSRPLAGRLRGGRTGAPRRQASSWCANTATRKFSVPHWGLQSAPSTAQLPPNCLPGSLWGRGGRVPEPLLGVTVTGDPSHSRMSPFPFPKAAWPQHHLLIISACC